MRRRLLIVEDTQLGRELLIQIFEEAYDLELAADGETAVRLAVAKKPDLILLDIGLPGMSGYEVVSAMRADTALVRTPIVAVTSRVMPGDRKRALAAGCTEFVGKPVDDLRLVALVERLLGEA